MHMKYTIVSKQLLGEKQLKQQQSKYIQKPTRVFQHQHPLLFPLSVTHTNVDVNMDDDAPQSYLAT